MKVTVTREWPLPPIKEIVILLTEEEARLFIGDEGTSRHYDIEKKMVMMIRDQLRNSR